MLSETIHIVQNTTATPSYTDQTQPFDYHAFEVDMDYQIQNGQWNNEQSSQLLDALAQMNPDEQETIIRKLTDALHSGELGIDPEQGLF